MNAYTQQTMWVFLNSGPVSVVARKDDRSVVLVRARRRDHLEAALREWDGEIIETPDADYRFRASLAKGTWAEILTEHTMKIDYPNFKDSIKDGEVKTTAMKVWSILAVAFGAYGRN